MRFSSLVVAAFVSTTVPSSASALNTWGTDMSDLWWNSSESGWGINIAHQQDILFATLFVYGPDGKVKWYVGSGLRSKGAADPYTFTGPFYETTGPYLGAAAFNPNNVVVRQVGTATLSLGVETGTLTYSVDGVVVTKSIQRNTFALNNVTGSYIGGLVGAATGCGTASGAFNFGTNITSSHNGSAIAIISTAGNGTSCTYAGTYGQVGRMGRVDGTVTCTNGARGSLRAFELEASYQGFFTRYTIDWGGGCTEAGRIAGLKL